MHPLLATAEAKLGVELPALAAAAARTEEARSDARMAIDAFVGGAAVGAPLIVAFGSMARQEMTTGSDFDYLVVLNELVRDPERIVRYRQAASKANVAIGAKSPGSSGLFGVAISGADLVNTIGLDTDTNLHLSRRVLLLEESTPLHNDHAWRELVEAVAARYLHEHRHPGPKVPRFLLNDVARYWRTVTVDYQAKRWQELTSEKWGMRYVKLITTRKLTFAGMIASLFTPVLFGTEATPEELREQFSLPALARLAQLEPHVGEKGKTALRASLLAADEIIGRFNDREFCRRIEGVRDPHSSDDPAMREAVRISEDIQKALEALFFSDEPLSGPRNESLGRITRRYLSF